MSIGSIIAGNIKVLKASTMRSVRVSLAICMAITGISTAFLSEAMAQSASVSQRAAALVFAQSKDVELPEDFLVRVDGDKLQVALESFGVIDAKRPIANLLVRLLDSSGAEKTATSNDRGIAEFTGVKADELHAVVVADRNVHGVIPLMTISGQKAADKGIVATQIRLPLIETNQTEILAAINRDIPPNITLTGSLYGLDDYNLQGLSLYRVRLQSDGNLLGRVIVADRDLAEQLRYAKLTFFRNQQVVARADSNPADGSFSVGGLSTGIHGVVAAGPAGYTAFAFDVLPPAAAPGGEAVLGLPVSFVQSNPSEKLFVFLVPPKMVPKVTERVREGFLAPLPSASEAIPTPMQPGFPGGFGGGGFGGGGGGGGEGGFGGGGLGGGMGGLAGLAGIAAVIANDSDSDFNGNVIVSPIVRP